MWTSPELRERRAQLPLLALALLVIAGAALRLAMIGAYGPGFIGISDSQFYIQAAQSNVFQWAAAPGGITWPAGYPVFLGFWHLLSDQLSFTILVQHLLGIATAVLLYLAVRRVVSAWWALLPAAVVLLAGPQIFLEHAAMTESLFAFLTAATCYCAVRALDGQAAQWGALAGALVTAAAMVRVVGVPLVGVVLVWLFVASRGKGRERATAALAATLAAFVLLGVYLIEMKRETGFGGPALTHSGSWRAPARASDPVDFADYLGGQLTRFWSSDHNEGRGTRDAGTVGYAYDGVVDILQTPSRDQRRAATDYYSTANVEIDQGRFDALRGYERHTRLEGLPFVLLLLLAAIGLPLARGRRLWVGILMLATALVTLITPVAYVYFDARYVVPGYGALAAAGAIGAAALWRWGVARREQAPARAERRGVPPQVKARGASRPPARRSRGGRSPARS